MVFVFAVKKEMSNSIFLFVTGLTLGILISLGLVNRYRSTQSHIVAPVDHGTPTSGSFDHIISSNSDGSNQFGQFEEIKVPKGHGMDGTETASSITATAPSTTESVDITSSSGVTTKQKKALPVASSFWVPGKEGSYIKSSEKAVVDAASAVSSSVVSGIETGMDKITDFFSGSDSGTVEKGSSSAAVGSVVAGGNSGATAALLLVQGGEEETEKAPVEEGALMPGKGQGGKKRRGKGRGSGKRGKGRKEGREDEGVGSGQAGSQGKGPPSKAAKESKETSLSALNAESSAQSRKSAGDDINLQSTFFNQYGERVDPFGSTRLGAKGKDVSILYTHPPLVPYHSQAYTKPLDPPYVPSLSSVMTQRAAMLPQVDLPTAAHRSGQKYVHYVDHGDHDVSHTHRHTNYL